MKRLFTFLVPVIAACLMISCVTKATEEKVKEACTNLQKLRGELDVTRRQLEQKRDSRPWG